MNKSFHSLVQVSKITRINIETLKKNCQSHSIDGAIKIGKTWLIPESFLASLVKPKAGVYIDGANILHGGLKSGWLVDYRKLLIFLKNRYDISIISFYDSIGYEWNKDKTNLLRDIEGKLIPKKSHLKFCDFLKGIGIRVITKPLKLIDNNPRKPKNNMDSYINLDVMNEKDLWDTLILFSGDSDFDRLVDEIIGLKKKVRVFSFKDLLSYELKMKAFTNPLVSFTEINKLKDAIQDSRNTKISKNIIGLDKRIKR